MFTFIFIVVEVFLQRENRGVCVKCVGVGGSDSAQFLLENVLLLQKTAVQSPVSLFGQLSGRS